MPKHYYAIGTTLAGLTNLETITTHAPQSSDGNRIPLLAPNRRQTLDRAVQRNGSINAPLRWDILTQNALRTLIVSYFGGYTVSSKAFYVIAIGEDGYYSPFAVTLERPIENEHYTVLNDVWLRDVQIPGYGWTLQSATKTGNYTVTASDRLLYANTASGSITFALPAAATPNPYTVFSFVKTSASNNMVLDPNSTELIDGASTKTVTALNARVDIYSDGSAWYSL